MHGICKILRLNYELLNSDMRTKSSLKDLENITHVSLCLIIVVVAVIWCGFTYECTLILKLLGIDQDAVEDTCLMPCWITPLYDEEILHKWKIILLLERLRDKYECELLFQVTKSFIFYFNLHERE